MSVFKIILVVLAFVLMFTNGILYVYAFKRYRGSLMASPIQTPPILISCLLGTAILLFLLSGLCCKKLLNDIGHLCMALFLFSYSAFEVRISIRELSELRKGHQGQLEKPDEEKHSA